MNNKLLFYKYNSLFAIIFAVGLVYGSTSCKETETPTPSRVDTEFLFTNNYHSTLGFRRLTVERSFVYYPGDTDWHYSHHPSIIYYNGKFVAIFSNGIHGEDEGYQRIMTSTSEDGKTWSEGKVLAGTDALHSITSGGLYISDKGELIAYFTISDYGEVLYRNAHLLASTSTNGVDWSERIDLNVPLFMSHSPKKIENGRLIITGSRKVYYNDSASGLTDWKLADNVTFNDAQSGLVEGDVVTTKDSIYILYRDVKSITKLWQQASKDGNKWGDAKND